MKLYEIDEAIMNCIDAETGEIIDNIRLNELQVEREKKIENVALWYKNEKSDAEQYKAEKLAFADKQAKAEAKAESLKKWLDFALNGEQYKSVKVNINYRKSDAVNVLDMAKLAENFLRVKKEADLTAIKEALKKGEVVEGAELIKKQNIQIK